MKNIERSTFWKKQWQTPKSLIIKSDRLISYLWLLYVTFNQFNQYSGSLIFTHYILKLKQLKYELKIKEHDTLCSSGLYKGLLIELLICSLFDPPNVNSIFSGKMLGGHYTYSLDDMMVVIAFAKCYVVIRLYYHYTKWNTRYVQALAKKHNVTSTYLFPFKCELKYRPFQFLVSMTFVTVTIVSVIMRVVEM